MAYVRTMTLDDLMTPDKYQRIKAELEEAISGTVVIDGDLTEDTASAICCAIRESIVPEIDGPHSNASALTPQASRYWVQISAEGSQTSSGSVPQRVLPTTLRGGRPRRSPRGPEVSEPINAW